MANPTKILVLEVGFIAHEDIGYSRTFDFEIEHLVLGDDLELDNLSGEIDFSRTSEGVLAQADFSAFTETICGRCLEKAHQPLESKFSELFTLPNRADKNTELILPANGRIDFAPILRDYMVLEVPINSVCREDCQGLCPECGVNRNHESCDCVIETIDPRFSDLKSLLEDKK
ncbi:MAG: DUF177 domain-containing protein [Anaerolineales bacterium]|nr:DUF177 domain-containing protein [Chloroflexota bacterium]MBL6981015.1 DUF177 domain-containing protein [Anaerolineales bacterium]